MVNRAMLTQKLQYVLVPPRTKFGILGRKIPCKYKIRDLARKKVRNYGFLVRNFRSRISVLLSFGTKFNLLGRHEPCNSLILYLFFFAKHFLYVHYLSRPVNFIVNTKEISPTHVFTKKYYNKITVFSNKPTR